MVENEIQDVAGEDPDGLNGGEGGGKTEAVKERAVVGHVTELATGDADGSGDESGGGGGGGEGERGGRWVSVSMKCLLKTRNIVVKFGTFVGPGFLVCSPPLSFMQHTKNFSKIAVAYIDPGNYSTDVAAGATYRFKLLFIVLMSNLFAVFLQSLCIKLGSVSGLNLAEACRAFLPKWLNIALYIMAEAAVSCSNSKFTI